MSGVTRHVERSLYITTAMLRGGGHPMRIPSSVRFLVSNRNSIPRAAYCLAEIATSVSWPPREVDDVVKFSFIQAGVIPHKTCFVASSWILNAATYIGKLSMSSIPTEHLFWPWLTGAIPQNRTELGPSDRVVLRRRQDVLLMQFVQQISSLGRHEIRSSFGTSKDGLR